MYSHNRLNLDTPPPTSHFRRPWSPYSYDPSPAGLPDDIHMPGSYPGQTPLSYSSVPNTYDPYNHSHSTRHARREPSDVSVEALDLADYTATLHRNDRRLTNISGPFLPFRGQVVYPPSPPPLRPFASRDTLPSLVSAGGSSTPSRSQSSHVHTPIRRPFSLPTPHTSSNPTDSQYGHSHNYPYLVEPLAEDIHAEDDITHFPSWSRNWYDTQKPGASYRYGRQDIDPMFSLPSHPDTSTNFYSYPSSSQSNRDLLPWSGQNDPIAHIPEGMKQERLRMLEMEFGGRGKRNAEDVPDKMVGSVDDKGKLITDGPKKRIVVRSLQGLFVVAAVVTSLYSVMILKPKKPPPPQGKLPAYILYGLSAVFLCTMAYLFLFRPCCTGKRKKPSDNLTGPGGMMVLPVQSLPNGKKDKKKKKGKKGDQQTDGVQVNLIVDPNMFGSSGRDRDREWEDDSDEDRTVSSAARRRRSPRRRGIFEGLALEEEWKAARSSLKKFLAFDIASMILWGAEFVLILMGKRCPAGTFDGWCDGYNLATALACFLAVLYGMSVFFDIKDLHMSRASPRTRT